MPVLKDQPVAIGYKYMNSYDVIIGANNDTHVVEINRIVEITSRYYDKYTIIPSIISIENGKKGRPGHCHCCQR